MTTRQGLTTISRYLSHLLRHDPHVAGLTLDPAGWALVDELLAKAQPDGKPLTLDLLREVVATSDKQRFAFSEDGLRIRASQGHSIDVELGLAPAEPPARLLHGTARRFLDAILREGLSKQQRHHVHLTVDPSIARAVGQRYGSVVLLAIDAARMHADGHVFFRSANGVWLTEHVPPAYLQVIPPTPT